MKMHFLIFFWNFQNFHHFSTFWKTKAVVNNQGLIELRSWKSQEIKLKYDIFKVNRTKLVTLIQNFIRNTNAMTKFMDVRRCLAEPIRCASVWQSCGKPSTKFPHGGLVECLEFNIHLSYSNLRNLIYLFISWKFRKILEKMSLDKILSSYKTRVFH